MLCRRSLLVLGASGLAMPWMAAAATNENDWAIRQHSTRFKGQFLAYSSISGRLPLLDDRARVRCRMSFTAYKQPSTNHPRPVTFFWNGGPGGAATTLHFRSFGPKLLTNGSIRDNQDTLLTTSDLVFVDPVDTGFSRMEDVSDTSMFYSTLGDVEWAARFVRSWMTRFGSTDQPVYAFGESFGVPRVAGVADVLTQSGFPLKGVVLASGGKILIDAELFPARKAAMQIPAKAIAAFQHGRLAPAAGNDLETVRRGALSWAQSTYEPALSHRATLSADQRKGLVTELAAWTGVDPTLIDGDTLLLDTRAFRRSVVPGENLYAYDLRLKAPPGTPETKARDAAAILDYYSTQLGYKTNLAYWPIEPGQPPVNARWAYTGDAEAIADATVGGGPPERQPWLSRAIDRRPDLKVMIATGIWDSQNQCEADRALLELATPTERRAITPHCYVGGHMMYDDASTRTEMVRDLAHFLTS